MSALITGGQWAISLIIGLGGAQIGASAAGRGYERTRTDQRNDALWSYARSLEICSERVGAYGTAGWSSEDETSLRADEAEAARFLRELPNELRALVDQGRPLDSREAFCKQIGDVAGGLQTWVLQNQTKHRFVARLRAPSKSVAS